MIAYYGTLPMWFQLLGLIGGFIMAGIFFVAISYRLWHYGVKIKAGVVELDATDDTSEVGNERKETAKE